MYVCDIVHMKNNLMTIYAAEFVSADKTDVSTLINHFVISSPRGVLK